MAACFAARASSRSAARIIIFIVLSVIITRPTAREPASAASASSTPPRLAALNVVVGAQPSGEPTLLVPTFDPAVTGGYNANVSDAAFEAAMGYQTEEAWTAGLTVVASAVWCGRTNGIDTVSPACGAGAANATTMGTHAPGTQPATTTNVTAKVALGHGRNEVSVTVRRASEPSSATTYVVTVTRLSLATHASLYSLAVAPGTLAPSPGE